MSISRNIELIAGVIVLTVVLLLAGTVMYYRSQSNNNKAEAELQTARADAAETYNAGHKALAKERSITNDKVEQAIEDNPAWADQPLPDDVADLLRNGKQTAPAVP